MLGEHNEGVLQQSLFNNTDKQAEETYPEVLPGNGHRRLNLVGVEIHLSQPCTPQSVHNVWAAMTPACMTKPATMETTTVTYPPAPNPTFSAVFVMKVEAELEVCPDRGLIFIRTPQVMRADKSRHRHLSVAFQLMLVW